MATLEEINNKLEHIEKLLMGNGKIGVAEMARRSFEYIQSSSSAKSGILDWAFRMVIMIVLGYIAMVVGLK